MVRVMDLIWTVLFLEIIFLADSYGKYISTYELRSTLFNIIIAKRFISHTYLFLHACIDIDIDIAKYQNIYTNYLSRYHKVTMSVGTSSDITFQFCISIRFTMNIFKEK